MLLLWQSTLFKQLLISESFFSCHTLLLKVTIRLWKFLSLEWKENCISEALCCKKNSHVKTKKDLSKFWCALLTKYLDFTQRKKIKMIIYEEKIIPKTKSKLLTLPLNHIDKKFTFLSRLCFRDTLPSFLWKNNYSYLLLILFISI